MLDFIDSTPGADIVVLLIVLAIAVTFGEYYERRKTSRKN